MEANNFFDQLTPVSLSSNPNYEGMATAHIVAGNGIFTYAKTKLGWKIVKDTNYTFNENLPKLDNQIEFNKSLPKIPLEAFNMMLAFYKGIYDRYKTEAQMNFYWNENGVSEIEVENAIINIDNIPGLKKWNNNLISYVPVQRNSAALTSTQDPIYDALRSQMMPFVETHSHNVMSAFKSGTDEANSYSDELQLVIGKITSDEFDFYNWVTIRGEQHDNLELSIVKQIVELPETFKNKSMEELPSIPEEWYAQHTTQTFRAPKSAATLANLTDEELAYLDYMKEDNSVLGRRYDDNELAFDYDEKEHLNEFDQKDIDEFDQEDILYMGRGNYNSFTNSGQNQKTDATPEADHTSTIKDQKSQKEKTIHSNLSMEETNQHSRQITNQKTSFFKRIFNKIFGKK